MARRRGKARRQGAYVTTNVLRLVAIAKEDKHPRPSAETLRHVARVRYWLDAIESGARSDVLFSPHQVASDLQDLARSLLHDDSRRFARADLARRLLEDK